MEWGSRVLAADRTWPPGPRSDVSDHQCAVFASKRTMRRELRRPAQQRLGSFVECRVIILEHCHDAEIDLALKPTTARA